MKVNQKHEDYVDEQLKKNRESRFIKSSLINVKGLSKSQASNLVKHRKKNHAKINKTN